MNGFVARITGDGIEISEEAPERLTPLPTANQTSPRGYYVYAHYDEHGVPFYIGKGTGRRAWTGERHALWHRYVKNHLAGKYRVMILADDLTEEQAEGLEISWTAQEADTLVNWISGGRKMNLAAAQRYHELRSANHQLIASARTQEKADPELAVKMYYKAIDSINAYASIKPEEGLLGRLIDEERSEIGLSGELAALDRLTLCLVRLGRGVEAQQAADKYFARFRADTALRRAEAIRKRVAKAARSD